MACQFMEWLIASAEPTGFQYALVGAGCLLAFGVIRRLRGKDTGLQVQPTQAAESPAHRRAA